MSCDQYLLSNYENFFSQIIPLMLVYLVFLLSLHLVNTSTVDFFL